MVYGSWICMTQNHIHHSRKDKERKSTKNVQLALNLFTILFVHKMWWSIKRFQCNWEESLGALVVQHKIKYMLVRSLWFLMLPFQLSIFPLLSVSFSPISLRSVSPCACFHCFEEIFSTYNFCNCCHGDGTFIHAILKMERKHVSRIAFLVYFAIHTLCFVAVAQMVLFGRQSNQRISEISNKITLRLVWYVWYC